MVTCFRSRVHRPWQADFADCMIWLFFCIAAPLFTGACQSIHGPFSAPKAQEPIPIKDHPEAVLTILHTNDTHSHFDEIYKELVIDGQKLTIAMGGYARLSTKINQVRDELSAQRPVLLLQAGDAFQGTLYFTLMQGLVSAKMMNFMRYDAMTVGGHEFDLGSSSLARYADDIAFPLLGANLEIRTDPLLSTRIKPYVIVEKGSERIGVIGLVHEASSAMAMPSRQTHFLDERAAAERYVALLKGMGVKKIVLLTHVGYEMDLKLARQVAGIDVIIGGYSHSLMGDLAAAGLKSVGSYPTVVTLGPRRKVCVAQAWEKGLALGRLDVYFDQEGRVSRCVGELTIPVGEDAFAIEPKTGQRVPLTPVQQAKLTAFVKGHPPLAFVPRDAKAMAVLQPYKDVVDKFAGERVAQLKEDLPLASFLDASGALSREAPVSQAATLAAKAFLWKLSEQHLAVDAALIPLSFVHKELKAGPLFVRDAYELLPYGNTLVLISIGKAELTALLENAMQRPGSLPQVYGLGMAVDMLNPPGSRISRIELLKGGIWRPLGEFERVRLCVSSALLAGDGDYVLEGLSEVIDTGLIDNEVLVEYLRRQMDIAADTSSHITWTSAVGG